MTKIGHREVKMSEVPELVNPDASADILTPEPRPCA